MTEDEEVEEEKEEEEAASDNGEEGEEKEVKRLKSRTCGISEVGGFSGTILTCRGTS